MNSKISEIVQKTAEVLYSHGLSMFDAEMQQHLISSCALGKVSELYENDELKEDARKSFLDAWFHAKISDIGQHGMLSCDNCRPTLVTEEYLIFIFYGIGMTKESRPIKNFADKLNELLLLRNQDNKVTIHHVAAYDDTADNNRLNDGLISDAVQVVLRAYMPYNSKIMQFCDMVIKACRKNPDAKLILIGYSGGGVVVSEMEEILKKRKVCLPHRIIRIGSPELKAPEESVKRTINIIIPGDPVPLVTFMREKDTHRFNNHYLLNIKYDSVNPLHVHSLYFSDVSDENGVKNYEKTALACVNYIK